MTDILRRLEKYEHLSLEQKIFHPELAQDINFIQKHMSSLNDNELNITKDFLGHLAKDIENKIGDLEKELAGRPQVMDQIQKTMEACLAYSKTPSKKETKE